MIKVTNDVLERFMSIYFSHNSKDGLRIEASYLVFILKTDNVERGSWQFSHIEFSLISDVTTTDDNDEINNILKFDDVIFLELNLSSTVVETVI